MNRSYARIAAESGAIYVDLWPALAQADGSIRPEMTRDGLHLSLAGYAAWVAVLRPLLSRFAD